MSPDKSFENRLYISANLEIVSCVHGNGGLSIHAAEDLVRVQRGF